MTEHGRSACSPPVAGIAVGSVRWQLVRTISTKLISSSGTLSGGDPLEFAGRSLRLVPKTDMAAVLTRTGITFLRENKPVGSTSLVGLLNDANHFDGTYLTGNKVQPIVFTDDLSRAYVGGNGVVYVIDLVTFKLISSIAIPAGKNITSLATAGGWLFLGEGQSYGTGASNSRLLVMDINPGSKDYNKAVTLKGTGIESSPLGISGMTMGRDGKTLVVATPINPNNGSLGSASKRGDVLIFDIGTLTYKTGRIDAPIKARLPADSLSGKAPQIISATNDPDRYLVANVADYNRGLSTLVITRDSNKKLVSANMASIHLSQPSDAIRIDRLDIQRAQSAVFVTTPDGQEYAIVSDDNYNFLDPYWKAMYEAPDFLFTPFGPPIAFGGSASAKKVAVGGKLGIVKDPFGKNGDPQFLGATLPLDGYGIINLSLSDDGKVLIGQLKGGYSADIFDMQQKPQQSHAWNVDALIQAALAMPDQDRLSKHIKLPADAEQLIANNAPPPAGTAFDDDIVLPKFEGRPGDINAIDVKKLILKQLEAQGITGAAIENFRVEEDLQTVFDDKERVVEAGRTDGYIAGTKEGKIQLLTAREGDQRKVLSREDVDGKGNDSADFSKTGVMFAYRNITDDEVHQRLQAGKMLSEQSRVFHVLFDLKKADGTLSPGSKALLTIDRSHGVLRRPALGQPGIFDDEAAGRSRRGQHRQARCLQGRAAAEVSGVPGAGYRRRVQGRHCGRRFQNGRVQGARTVREGRALSVRHGDGVGHRHFWRCHGKGGNPVPGDRQCHGGECQVRGGCREPPVPIDLRPGECNPCSLDGRNQFREDRCDD